MESTLIYRVSDGLPLAGSSDDDNTHQLMALKKRCKQLLGKLSQQSLQANGMGEGGEDVASSIEDTGSQDTIHYLISGSVIYMCITPVKFPKKLAYSYLSEISNEFRHVYGPELSKPELKPYQFMQFDSFLSKTKKIYSDSRVQSNLDKLNSDLSDVKMIMNKNIEDILYRGDSLDKLQDLSQNLKTESKKYRKYAEKINFRLLIKQYAPVAILALVILFILYRLLF
ncbi:DEKNAAC102187 [Brettanomyces naardenensis]|uniref:Protein transport protein SEC22 n=1 Tax=Brettanomyces naardenensis TaxID=13370 RepID=A0A448YJV4_BRENA|nr:DEKNAAC102187 [Brettanomyces naardenensis]